MIQTVRPSNFSLQATLLCDTVGRNIAQSGTEVGTCQFQLCLFGALEYAAVRQTTEAQNCGVLLSSHYEKSASG